MNPERENKRSLVARENAPLVVGQELASCPPAHELASCSAVSPSGYTERPWTQAILRHRWLILQVVLAGVAVGALFSIWARPLYRSSAIVVVEPSSTRAGFPAKGWLILLKSRENATQAAASIKEQAGLAISPEEIRQSLRPRITRPTGEIEIAAVHEDPRRAMLIANGTAEAFRRRWQALTRQEMDAAASYFAADLKDAREEFIAAEKALHGFATERSIGAGELGWTPEMARLTRLAEAAATIYSGALEQTQKAKLEVLAQKQRLSIAGQAEFPNTPFRPQVGLNLMGGALGGLFLGLALALGLQTTDRRIRSSREAAATVGAPILGMIRKCKPAAIQPAILLVGGLAHPQELAKPDLSLPIMEDYRSLASNVKMVFEPTNGAAPALLLVSARRKEGRSSVLLNLGAALADSGKRTLLVEADLRAPVLAANLGLNESPGLSDILLGYCGPEEALWPTRIEGLTLLPAGRHAEDPIGVFDRAKMGEVLRELRGHAEIVLLDSPALGECGDALLISPHCDGVLLVWEPSDTSRQEVQQACQLLAAAGAWPSGLICNKVGAGWIKPSTYRYYFCHLPPA